MEKQNKETNKETLKQTFGTIYISHNLGHFTFDVSSFSFCPGKCVQSLTQVILGGVSDGGPRTMELRHIYCCVPGTYNRPGTRRRAINAE